MNACLLLLLQYVYHRNHRQVEYRETICTTLVDELHRRPEKHLAIQTLFSYYDAAGHNDKDYCSVVRHNEIFI